MIDYSKFQKSLQQLQRQHANLQIIADAVALYQTLTGETWA